MNKNIKGAIVVIVILSGFAYYFYTNKKKNNSIDKNDSVEYYSTEIVKAGKHADYDFIKTFDKSFLKEWFNAIKNNQDTFVVEGKTINTQGGRVKK